MNVDFCHMIEETQNGEEPTEIPVIRIYSTSTQYTMDIQFLNPEVNKNEFNEYIKWMENECECKWGSRTLRFSTTSSNGTKSYTGIQLHFSEEYAQIESTAIKIQVPFVIGVGVVNALNVFCKNKDDEDNEDGEDGEGQE
jgi:hypothetical protein